MKVTEIPVCRSYPKDEKTPTKISPIKGNWKLVSILFANLLGKYKPSKVC
jgi:dolichol-phosphate mannosyltransferase